MYNLKSFLATAAVSLLLATSSVAGQRASYLKARDIDLSVDHLSTRSLHELIRRADIVRSMGFQELSRRASVLDDFEDLVLRGGGASKEEKARQKEEKKDKKIDKQIQKNIDKKFQEASKPDKHGSLESIDFASGVTGANRAQVDKRIREVWKRDYRNFRKARVEVADGGTLRFWFYNDKIGPSSAGGACSMY